MDTIQNPCFLAIQQKLICNCSPQEIKIYSAIFIQGIDVELTLLRKAATTPQICFPAVKKPKHKEARGNTGFTFVQKCEGRVSIHDVGIYQFDFFRKWITGTLCFLPFYFCHQNRAKRNISVPDSSHQELYYYIYYYLEKLPPHQSSTLATC